MAQEHITPDTRSIGKVRYSHRGADCTLTPMENGMIKCVFDEPQRAMTPGQAAVFYQDGHVLCGGTIEKDDGKLAGLLNSREYIIIIEQTA